MSVPELWGLGPTHRAVGEMRSAGVDAQTLASFLHDTQLQQRSGETPDFSNTLFLLDESSMVGNTDMGTGIRPDCGRWRSCRGQW